MTLIAAFLGGTTILLLCVTVLAIEQRLFDDFRLKHHAGAIRRIGRKGTMETQSIGSGYGIQCRSPEGAG